MASPAPSPADSQAYQGSMRLESAGSDFNVIDFIARQIMGEMRTATLVQVKSVNGGGVTPVGTVDVQPMIAQLDGKGNAYPHATINNVPYMRLQGGANAIIIDPKVGDIGIAVFAGQDISSAKQNKTPSNPGSRRRFDWADGLYLGGVLNGVPTQYVQIDDEGGITITSADGKPVAINAPGGCTITTPTATIDGDLSVTGDAAITGKVSTGAGSTFNGKSFDTHTHGGVTAGAGVSGPPS